MITWRNDRSEEITDNLFAIVRIRVDENEVFTEFGYLQQVTSKSKIYLTKFLSFVLFLTFCLANAVENIGNIERIITRIV